MARRATKTTEAPASVGTSTEETGMTETAPEVTETPETTTPTEAPAPATEAPKEDKPVDLTGFKAAVAAAVAESDTSTGTVSEVDLASVTTAYRELEGLKAKNAAKAFINDQMKDSMNGDNLPLARAYLNISEKALVALAGGSKAPAEPKDPTENFVQRVSTLTLAYQLAVGSVPEGVTEGWEEKVTATVDSSREAAAALVAWNAADPESRGDEPESSAVVRNAVKLSVGKAAKAGVSRGGGTFTGDRRDIGVHIENAFADKPVGTFMKIAEIRAVKSDEYGDALPSAGAISARLFPRSGNSTMPKVGIKPDTQDGKKGAVKIEVDEAAATA